MYEVFQELWLHSDPSSGSQAILGYRLWFCSYYRAGIQEIEIGLSFTIKVTVFTKTEPFFFKKCYLNSWKLLDNSQSSKKVSLTIFASFFIGFLEEKKLEVLTPLFLLMELTNCFLKWLYQLIFPSAVYESCNAFILSPILCIVSLFCFRYSNRYIVISFRGFNLCSLNKWHVECFFQVFVICISFSEVSFQIHWSLFIVCLFYYWTSQFL